MRTKGELVNQGSSVAIEVCVADGLNLCSMQRVFIMVIGSYRILILCSLQYFTNSYVSMQ